MTEIGRYVGMRTTYRIHTYNPPINQFAGTDITHRQQFLAGDQLGSGLGPRNGLLGDSCDRHSSASTRSLYHLLRDACYVYIDGHVSALMHHVARSTHHAVNSAYSMLSASACHDDSMMFADAPTVLHEVWPFRVSMMTRVMAAVAASPSRMRTL